MTTDVQACTTSRFALYYYGLSAALMTVYGGLVCPFVDSLPVWRWALVLVAGYALAFAARLVLEPRLIRQPQGLLAGRRQFLLDTGLPVLLGAGLTAFDTLVFGFPVESGLKVLLATLCFGFFMALDMTLQRERLLAASGISRDVTALPFASLTRRIVLLASCVVAFNASLVILVVFKDLLYLHALPADLLRHQSVFVGLEIVFVSLTILAFTLRIVWAYSRNLRMVFDIQTETLRAVRNGNLDVQVPVLGHDEFGLIAHGTNQMIVGLREKQRIRSLLGKVVDDRVAEQLLQDSAQGVALGGTRRSVIVLMSDIRNFTAFSEQAEPETVVEELNAYFSTCVRIVAEHGGMVDKFIGDGMLAVFGLVNHAEGAPCTCHDDALRAALDMLHALGGLEAELGHPMRIGIGMHAGQVVSGLVGSPDRLEFTVIGDTVNTAARLESLSKELTTPLVISDAVYNALSDPGLKQALEPAGEHRLKGKRNAVAVWRLKG